MTVIPLGDIETIRLADEEHREIANLLAEYSHVVPVADVDGYVLGAQLATDSIPRRLRTALLTLRAKGSDTGGLLIRNVPTGAVPQTPPHADLGLGSALPAAWVLSVIVSALGEQFGFRAELGGRIIQDILPVRGFEDTQQSISSRSLLQMHCETAFTTTRADFVALLCLRSDPAHEAATLLSPAADVLGQLDSRTIELLRQPQFTTTVDSSFLRGSGVAGPLYVTPIRILSGSRERPRLRCDFAETAGLDAESQRALETLHRAVSEAARAVRLEPGDLLIVDNHGAFHGRTPFTANQDGGDRWLLRTFIARDLARSVAWRPGNGRIVDIDYTRLSDEADHAR